jgi:hypothetical protein
MASKPEIRVAENVSNAAEKHWEKSAQNKLAEEIGSATKTKLEDLKDKIPVRVAEKGDTIGAIILGMKKGGVESLAGKNIWGLDVEYHAKNGEIKTLKLAQAAKLLPGEEVSFDGEKVIVKSAVAKKSEAEKQPEIGIENQPTAESVIAPEVAAQQAAKPAKKAEKQPATESSNSMENSTPTETTPEAKAKSKTPKEYTPRYSEELNGGNSVRGKVAPKPDETQIGRASCRERVS